MVTDVKEGFTFPCGACRQFIAEFGEVEIIVANNDKQYESTKISTLLPHSFLKSDLIPEKRKKVADSDEGSTTASSGNGFVTTPANGHSII